MTLRRIPPVKMQSVCHFCNRIQQDPQDRLAIWENLKLSLEGYLKSLFGGKVSLNWLTSSNLELREKIKCIEHIGKPKKWDKLC